MSTANPQAAPQASQPDTQQPAPDILTTILQQQQEAFQAQQQAMATQLSGTQNSSTAGNPPVSNGQIQAPLNANGQLIGTNALEEVFNQQALQFNILNYKGANTAFIDAVGVATQLGIWDKVKDKICPFPQQNFVLVSQPAPAPAPAPAPPASATAGPPMKNPVQEPAGVSSGNQGAQQPTEQADGGGTGGAIGTAAGTIAGGAVAGPIGAAVGSEVGSLIGNKLLIAAIMAGSLLSGLLPVAAYSVYKSWTGTPSATQPTPVQPAPVQPVQQPPVKQQPRPYPPTPAPEPQKPSPQAALTIEVS